MKPISSFPKNKLKELSETPVDELQVRFPEYRRSDLRSLRRKQITPKSTNVHDHIREDLEQKKRTEAQREFDRKYKALLEHVDVLEAEKEAMVALGKPNVSHTIKPMLSSGKGEATAVLVASDWHIEEKVSPEAVNGSPGYSLSVAKKRAEEFFQTGLHLRDIESKNTPIPTMVLALLGDFITGNLHTWHGTPGNTTLEPVEAAYEAKGIIKDGIDFLLKESDLNLVIPCHAGNHSRITAKSADSESEMGNSLEYFVYGFLAQEYATNPRVKFLISRSYASRLQIYDMVLRFHHGHKIKYGGGIGGLAVPASKYVLRKNTHWHADMDVFGHHHQKQKGPRFICNGSMIGYNAYASDGAFEYEEPSQTFFLINKRWKEVIDYRPILFSQ